MQMSSEWQETFPEGRSLRATVFQALSSLDLRAPICVSPETPVSDAVRLMNEQRIGALLVTSPRDQLIGIFTERDVLKKVLGGDAGRLDRPVRELMTAEPCRLHRDDAIVFALKLMHEGGFRHVPIVDAEGHPFAVVSVKDVVEFMVGLFARELMTAPPAPSHLTPSSPEGA